MALSPRTDEGPVRATPPPPSVRFSSSPAARASTASLTAAALGVVYGDIGTNPLFALQECFGGTEPFATSPANVLGVLSLVFWALVLVVSVKYIGFIMRAANDGEGGILALLALVPTRPKTGERPRLLVLMVLFGAALLYGDGIVTPAISVLSAVEGMKIAAPATSRFVVPLTVVILIVLFTAQRRGTQRLGSVFGPIMLLWFLIIGGLGAAQIVLHPAILAAVDPRHAIAFLLHGSRHAYLALGGLVLCIAGGEALYADMGHFGRRPIAIAWHAIVLPSLVLNYFGQGAFLMAGGVATGSPFFAIVPQALLIPMVVLATMATVIASQALISGAYSLTQQAISLGYFPRVDVIHTSAHHFGQIYVPFVNMVLMVACLSLVVGFGASDKLAAAYGLAVSGTMTMTSIAFFFVLVRRWGWNRWVATGLVSAFLGMDLAFLGGNMGKMLAGGWVPVGIGAVIYLVMTTWMDGRRLLAAHMAGLAVPLDDFLADVAAQDRARVSGTGVFMTANANGVPAVLSHHWQHNQVLHEQVVLLSIAYVHVPFVADADRAEVKLLGEGIYQVIGRVGFLERIRVPLLLAACGPLGLAIDPARASYYLGRETLIPGVGGSMSRWRKVLFALISRNAQSASGYFGVPANRVVELGMQVEI